MESDANYFRRRASEEYLAANRAGPPVAFRAHLEIADRYTELADAIEAEERKLATNTNSAFFAAEDGMQARAGVWL